MIIQYRTHSVVTPWRRPEKHDTMLFIHLYYKKIAWFVWNNTWIRKRLWKNIAIRKKNALLQKWSVRVNLEVDRCVIISRTSILLLIADQQVHLSKKNRIIKTWSLVIRRNTILLSGSEVSPNVFVGVHTAIDFCIIIFVW